MKARNRMDDYGDDYGLRKEASPSSTVVVAVVVHRKEQAERDQGMQADLSHERLDIYRVYLDAASLCADIAQGAGVSIVALDHLDRAIESIGVNFMHANRLTFGSPQRMSYLDVSIASTHECAASLDVCLARDVVEEHAYTAVLGKLWRVRGMLLGLKRVGENRVREISEAYGAARFPFVELDLYQVALHGVRWTHELLEELEPKARVRGKLDTSTTGTVLNIAEGHGRASTADQNRFMETAQNHACQTLLLLDLAVARKEVSAIRVADGKATQARVISMLHAWRTSHETKERAEP
jgi:four helix bundle protein